MSKRLPNPGEDHGNWGDILNSYLLVAHAEDGRPRAGVIGTSQLQDGAVSVDKLDASLKTALGLSPGASQPEPALMTAAMVTEGGAVAPYYAPEDYGCAVAADAATNDAAIAAAIQDASVNNGVVQFIGKGPYAVSQAIDQDVSLFVVRGNKTILNVDDGFNGSYFWSLYSSANYQYSFNQGVALSGIVLQGAALGTTPLAAAAVQLGHGTLTNNSLFSLENIYLQGFAIGFKYTHNAWRIKVSNARVTGGVAISVAANLANFGENMQFENCMFESYNPLVNIGTGEWNFVNCSFDSTLTTLNGNCIVKLNGCHIEPHTVYPCVNLSHPQAAMIMDNTTLVIDPNVSINCAAFNVVSTNTTYGLTIRNFDTIQSAKYTPQVNSRSCVLVSGNGRVDIQGFSSYVNGYGYAISTSSNLIYNGDGEKGTTAGWTTFATYGGPTSFTADNTAYKYGSYSLKLGVSAGSIYVGQVVPCRAGQWVFAQCWNKLTVESGTGNTFIDIDFLNTKGDVIQTTGYTNVTTTTFWTCRRQLGGMTPVAPAGTVSARLYIGVVGSGSTTAWYDDIILNVA